MNQRGWSLSSYIGYAVVLIIFVLIIAFNVIRLSRIGVVDINQETIEPIMIGENRWIKVYILLFQLITKRRTLKEQLTIGIQ